MTQQKDPDEVDAVVAPLRDELREVLAEHPDAEALLTLADGAEPSEALALHLEGCSACREILGSLCRPVAETEDLAWRRIEQRLDRRASPWKRRLRPLALAAAIVASALGGLVLMDSGPETPPPSTTRGAFLEALGPVGTVAPDPEFHWAFSPLAVSYRVEIRRDGELEWSHATLSSPLRAPAGTLEPGLDLEWRVVGLDSAGRSLGASAWSPFRIEPEAPVQVD